MSEEKAFFKEIIFWWSFCRRGIINLPTSKVRKKNAAFFVYFKIFFTGFFLIFLLSVELSSCLVFLRSIYLLI